MNTQTTLPASRLQQAMRSPLVQLIAGFLLIVVPAALWQTFVLSLDIPRLLRGFLVAAVSVPIALGAYYVLVYFIEGRVMSELSPSGAVREVTLGILIGAALLGGIMAILALSGTYRVLGINSLSVLLAPLLFAISPTVLEEILFRGVLFRLIERSLGSWPGLAISAAIFGGLHLTNENATLVGALAIMLSGGILLGAAFMLTRRLWLPMGIHFAANLIQSGIIGAAVSGNQAGQGLLRSSLTGPDLLTGGVFGVEASLVTLAASLVVSVLLLWQAAQRGRFLRRSK